MRIEKEEIRNKDTGDTNSLFVAVVFTFTRNKEQIRKKS